MIRTPKCNVCERLFREKTTDYRCELYPESVPDEVLSSAEDVACRDDQGIIPIESARPYIKPYGKQ